MNRLQPTRGTLADGRALYLFDDRPRRRLPPVDRRVPTQLPPPSEARWDPIMGEWVVIAPHRMGRGHTPETGCALCPSAGGAATEIPVASYDVAVFDNRYPALREPGSALPDVPTSLWAVAAAGGRCEVVSFSEEHRTSLAHLPVRRVATVVEAWAHRTEALNNTPGVEQVVCFENRGADIGATQSHPHGQIYGYPFVPARFARMRELARRARVLEECCLFCEVLAAEERAGERVVVRSAHWTAFVPHAARWPYEVHLYARRHVPDLPGLTSAERAELAGVYRAVLRCFDDVAEEPLPYMATWVQAPARRERDLTHLHAQIISDRFRPNQAKRLAAGELGAGAFVTEVVPENTARSLRKACEPTWRDTY
ncbi:galactose-1-phosphate uridylyltransferase [Streptomyces sp. NPDC057620]|uniref:galactose-1-phosphate uridylyltransferase n=1 Tax=Streptomyces sp. NPDC057620 TaxID=3346185 RepID=UPI0036822D74